MPATRIEAFTVTIPANTVKDSPVTVDTAFNQGTVIEIELDIPPGPSGYMGFQLAYGEQVIIPYSNSEYIVADNDKLRWPILNFPAGKFWAVIGYNTDIYDHALYVRYLIDDTQTGELVQQAQSIIQPTGEIVVSSGQGG